MPQRLMALAQLIKLVTGWLNRIAERKKRQEREENEQKLRDDPAGFFNGHFGGVRDSKPGAAKDATGKADSGSEKP